MDIKIIDDSDDKKYFTIIPNYVCNHSSAVDRGLYLYIKRIAGESGLCFITEETMCEKNEIGKEQLHKSLKYLLDHKWIEFVGMTPRKTRPTKTYKVLNLWKQNIEFYNDKKIPPETAVSQPDEKDSAVLGGKIPPENGVEEDIYKEELYNNTSNEPAGSGVSSLKEILQKRPIFIDKPKVGATYQWQDTAVRWWQKLGLKGNPPAVWFKLFKLDAGIAERSCSWASDSGGDNLERLTYWAFNQFKKNGRIVYAQK